MKDMKEKGRSYRKGKLKLTQSTPSTPVVQAYFHFKRACIDPTSKQWDAHGMKGRKFDITLKQWGRELGPKPAGFYAVMLIDDKEDFKSGNIKWGTVSELRENRWRTKAKVVPLLEQLPLLSFVAIGNAVGVSRERVRQIAMELGITGKHRRSVNAV